jgi:flagellar basal body rod protein FlgG
VPVLSVCRQLRLMPVIPRPFLICWLNPPLEQACSRLRPPKTISAAFDPLATGEGVRVIGYRLKIKPGRLVDTGNPSHVAVQRECFFAVKLPTGEEQYTRVGRLVLDTERRLCIDLGDRDLPVTPEVKLPDGATRFTVQSGQLQVAVEGQAEPMAVGPLQVAEFFDASRLQPMGGGLYGATTASGKPKKVAAELVFQSLEYPLIEGVFQNAAARRMKSDPVADAHQE